jgi:hypothetical protein
VSDPAMEYALYEIESMRRCAGLELNEKIGLSAIRLCHARLNANAPTPWHLTQCRRLGPLPSAD